MSWWAASSVVCRPANPSSTYWGRLHSAEGSSPETEELVGEVVRSVDHDASLRILDVGTGSGCIAVSLALELPHAQVAALDVSPAALEVARRNARRLHAEVRFMEANLLQADTMPQGEWHAVVSNPPYVRRSERDSLSAHVKDHEPALALFVDDADALCHYRCLAQWARLHLVWGGQLFVEINSALAEETLDLFRHAGFGSCALYDDPFGLPRFIHAVL